MAAGIVIAAFGFGPAFAINSFSFLLLVVGLLIVVPARVQQIRRRSSLGESVAILRAKPQLAIYLLIVVAVSFAADPVNTESPAVAHAFGRPSTWSGAVVGFFGLGAVVASIAIAGRVTGSRRRIGKTLVLLGSGIVLMAVSPWLPLALGFLFVAGVGYLSSNAAVTARLQLGVEESQRGGRSWLSGPLPFLAPGRLPAFSTARSPTGPASVLPHR
jgi:hypothetical protein